MGKAKKKKAAPKVKGRPSSKRGKKSREGSRQRAGQPSTSETVHLFVVHAARFIREGLSKEAEGRNGTSQRRWTELSVPEQSEAIQAAFVAGVDSRSGQLEFVHPPAKSEDARVSAFQLGRSGSSEDLVRLSVRPWVLLDQAGQVLGVRLAEFLGSLASSAAVALIEVLARLPCGPDEDPLEDPRILALEKSSKRPLALEAALHRLGLTKPPGVGEPNPAPLNEPLRDIAVRFLRVLSEHSGAWRSFPGVWISLCFPGEPTNGLCFLSPTGQARRNPMNFAGAWVALACDCLQHAAAGITTTEANAAALAGCALLAIAPIDDPFKSRLQLHVAHDAAFLAVTENRVTTELRHLALELSLGSSARREDSPEIVARLAAASARIEDRHVAPSAQSGAPVVGSNSQAFVESPRALLAAIAQGQDLTVAALTNACARLDALSDVIERHLSTSQGDDAMAERPTGTATAPPRVEQQRQGALNALAATLHDLTSGAPRVGSDRDPVTATREQLAVFFGVSTNRIGQIARRDSLRPIGRVKKGKGELYDFVEACVVIGESRSPMTLAAFRNLPDTEKRLLVPIFDRIQERHREFVDHATRAEEAAQTARLPARSAKGRTLRSRQDDELDLRRMTEESEGPEVTEGKEDERNR